MGEQSHLRPDRSFVARLKPRARSLLTYLRVRAKVLRTMVEDLRHPGDYGPYAVPPPLLRHRVQGLLGRESFMRKGEICAANIRELLASVGRDVYSFNHVLDFGCGCARVLRCFADRPPSCRLFGTDIDPVAVAWCRRHLDFAEFDTNGPLPPTRYAAGTFDLIYAVSVFTHLDEEMQFAWLRELKRIAQPGGVLILSVHGESLQAGLSAELRARLAAHGFAFMVGQTGRLKLDGLPDFYQTAFHAERYVRKNWSRFFEVVRCVERGINNHQDAVILINR